MKNLTPAKGQLRRVAVGVVAIAAFGVSAGTAQAKPFKATLKTPSSQPKINKNWHITVTVRSNSGQRLHATAVYKFLFQGQVVSTQYPNPGGKPGSAHKPYAFTGQYSDDLLFPARSAGIPLTVRVAVTVKGKGTVNLNKAVRVPKK